MSSRLQKASSNAEPDMPLVRISLLRGKPEGFGKKVGVIVYRTMVDTINVPTNNHFQVITEHDKDSLIYDPSYLGIARTDGVIFIQTRLNEGRTVELKKAFYKTLVERLHVEVGVSMEDILINSVEIKKENWSFGNGIAQYA